MTSLRLALLIGASASIAACGPNAEHQRADSAAVSLSTSRAQLATRLASQKDSLTRLVLQADDFIMRIDSSVSSVKGMPKGRKVDPRLDPLARQIENRKVVIARVDALVQRARATANQLSKANANNAVLRGQIATDSALIADLGATIKHQSAVIETLGVRVDSLRGVTVTLASNLSAAEAAHNKAYYVIGREDDLLKSGVIVREGGANLLIAHPGRTLQVARTLDPQLFTPVDQRGAGVIAVPDTTRRYRVISRQSLDDAQVSDRDQNAFKGNLKIASASKFWAPSRFLVLVEE